MACDRALEASMIQTRGSGSGGGRGGAGAGVGAGAVVSRHAALTSSLSSIAPAGGSVGANTRRLIAATNPNALFNSPRLAKEMQASMNAQQQQASSGLTPRPPAAGGQASSRAVKDKRHSTSADADGSIAPFNPDATDSASALQAAADKAARKSEKKRIKAESSKASTAADASTAAERELEEKE